MRKIYSLVLMATALLIGTNAWADGVIEIVRGGAVLPTTYYHLKEAFAAAKDGDTLQLTDNMTESETKAAWLGAPSSGTLENYASPDSENPQNGYRSVTLDLKGHMYYNSGARYVIALTRGKLRITSTGGEGEIKLKKHGIAVFGTYLKIDAKTQTPFSHLIIDENVKITEGEKGVYLTVMNSNEATSNVKWADTYPVDYRCDIFPNSQWGIANGARIDIYGKLETTEYACQVSGNVRSALEFLNSDGTYRTTYYNNKVIHFPLYWKKSDTELYLPGTNSPDSKAAEPLANAWSTTAYYDAVVSNSNDYVLTLDDNNYAAYVHIHPTAKLTTNNQDEKTAVGFYSAGYSRVYIEGTCEGSTGLYVKSGDVELHDAIITSNYSGDYAAANPTSSGVDAGGSGIVIESNKGYTGNIDATVSGDTYVKGSTGYAIDEAVTNAEGSEVDAITITGGTFVGGGEGTMKLSETTVTEAEDPNDQTTIKIEGGAVANGQTTITVGDDEIPLTDFLADTDNTNSHVTYVEDETGNTTMIISQGTAPETYEDLYDPTAPTPWSWCADEEQSGKSVAWTKIEDAEIASGTVILGELQINSGSLLDGNQQLTIHDGATLQVERLIMNGYARIIVEAGGKLIVTGTQGISAPSINNILLKNEENKPAVFLFNPAVSSNKHPNGTVEFTSKGYNKGGSDYGWQKFGIPTQTGELTEISIEGDVATAFGKFNYAAATPAWEVIGYLNTTPALDLNDLNQSFEYYQMLHNTTTVGTKVTFKGKLVGNDCPAPAIRANFWNGYANSYSAPIDGDALLTLIPAPADKAYYLYEMDVLTEKFSWVAKSMLLNSPIQPMQPFLVRNPQANVTALALDYGEAVYTPAMTSPNSAPARRVAADDMTKVEFIVRGENGVDHVLVAEDAQFSAEFDNGYDVAKYMNDDVNMYVSAEEKMAIFATDDIENTYLGFQTVKGGKYTIEFANVKGEELTLIDHETNARVAMVAGNTYDFTAAANSINDYRFEIVAAAKMPTAIENTEAVKNAKGIYTITGQYVGEMNVWNSLPAGVYVIDGAKRVK